MAGSRKRGNGEGTIYRREPQGDYRVELPYPDGKRRSAVRPTYAEAEEWLVTERSARDRGALQWSTARMPTLNQWLDHWIATKQEWVKPRTVECYLGVRRRYIPNTLGNRPLDKVDAVSIDRLYMDLPSRGLSEATVHLVHRVLRAAFNEAFKKQVIRHNPMNHVTAPRKPRPRTDALTPEEIAKVISKSEGTYFHALWMICLILGLRQGESLALRWEDFDFESKTLSVRGQVRHDKTEGWVFESTKADDVRELPLPDELITALRKHKAMVAQRRLAAGSRWRDFDLVFPSTYGTPIDQRNDRRNWFAALDEAGVRRVRRHDARHSAGTLAYLVTRDAVHVQRTLGHKQAAFTIATYVHPDVESMRAGTADAARRVVN